MQVRLPAVKGIYTVPELPGLGQEMTKDAMDNALMHVTVDRNGKRAVILSYVTYSKNTADCEMQAAVIFVVLLANSDNFMKIMVCTLTCLAPDEI